MAEQFTTKDCERAVRMVAAGRTQAEAAQAIGCSVGAVRNWMKCSKRRSKTNRTPQFIPVTISDTDCHEAANIEIVTPNGYTLRVGEINSEKLTELIGVVRSC